MFLINKNIENSFCCFDIFLWNRDLFFYQDSLMCRLFDKVILYYIRHVYTVTIDQFNESFL